MPDNGRGDVWFLRRCSATARSNPVNGVMGNLVGYGILALVVLAPLLRRLYIEAFWTHAEGRVIRLGGGMSTNPGPGGGTWVWAPVVEYRVDGKSFSAQLSYWQSFNARSKYKGGDKFTILYNPHRPSRAIADSWLTYIVFSIIIGGVIATRLQSTR